MFWWRFRKKGPIPNSWRKGEGVKEEEEEEEFYIV